MTTPSDIPALIRAAADAPTGGESALRERLALADEAAAQHVFTARWDEQALAQARHADALRRLGVSVPPLAGLPVTVKDLFDVAGTVTTAGSVLREGAPAARADAPAVARLRAAGAAIIGKTTMTEFAFSGVGINPHHGTPRNPSDPQLARIPGGSSSGAAVSVALGLAVAGLGSDTGGSIRVPAALCGIVGFKGTQARVPTAGAFPLSHTLDTVCAMTHTVADALTIDAVLAGQALAVERRPLAGRRLWVPQTLCLDTLEPAVAAAFADTLSILSRAGAQLVEGPWPLAAEVAALNRPGGFSAVEAWAFHREAMQRQRERFDPRVAARIALGEGVSAADYLAMVAARRDWIARAGASLDGFDAWICPTVPIVAPPIAELESDDEAFFRANGLLLRNTFVVNFMDGCAFSLPCQATGAPPVGLMVASRGGDDARLASVALAIEDVLRSAGRGRPAARP